VGGRGLKGDRGGARGRPLYVTIMLPRRWAQSNCPGHKNQKGNSVGPGNRAFA